MSKQISFEYKGTNYTLEFNRKTVQAMERDGFIVQEIESKPMTALPMLFAGAFRMHHRFIKRELIDEIYDAMPNKDDLIGKLAEMYNEPLVALLNEPEEGSEKKVEWKATW